MNKNIKKIIALTILCSAFSTWMPSTLNIGAQPVYAYSKDEISTLGLASGVSVVPLYTSVTHNGDYRIKKGEKIPMVFYSKISSNKTNINLSTIETKAAEIRVFVGKDNLKLDNIYSPINISEGESKSIYIRLYDSKNASDSDYALEYELVVEREASDEENIIETDNGSADDDITLKTYDDVYLNRLVLFDLNNNKIDIDFNQTQPIYNINVDANMSYINVKAVPEQQSYKLYIDNKELDPSDDKDTRLVTLDKGKNVIKIKIISSDHKSREYYLNVTRGNSTPAASNNSAATTINKSSQNIQTEPCWQYKKADGTIAVGWTFIGSEWYYFDTNGGMKTGWLQESTGKWYYLKASGAMAKNAVIDGYKIGTDGVCVTK